MLQTQTVAEDTLALIKRLMADAHFSEFVLVGGTSLALQLGHRTSIDIDLFTQKSFDAAFIAGLVEKDYKAENIKAFGNNVICSINGIKTDIMTHDYPEVVPHKTIENIRMASLEDISAMKINAIRNSGNRIKDFADIYVLLEHMPLTSIYKAYETKYASTDTNWLVARLALNHFQDLNTNEEIPFIDRAIKWPEIQNRIVTSLEFPNRIFHSPGKQIVQNKPKPPRKSRGLGR